MRICRRRGPGLRSAKRNASCPRRNCDGAVNRAMANVNSVYRRRVTMGRSVDLVADLGEGFGAYRMGDDDALLDVLTSANVACGFHAGDPRIMDATVASCAARGIGVGAHPSFPDLAGFGRRAMDLTADEVRTDVLYQVGALQAFTTAHGTRVRHVAPHGRLGNLVATRQDYADAVTDAVASLDQSLMILAQNGKLADAARARGLRVA